MKAIRRLFSLLLAACMLLTLLPTPAAAEGNDDNSVVKFEGQEQNQEQEQEQEQQQEQGKEANPEDTSSAPNCTKEVSCPAEEHENGCLSIAVTAVQGMINALAEQVTAENLSDVTSKVSAIIEEMKELGDAQNSALQLERYNSAVNGMAALLPGEVTTDTLDAVKAQLAVIEKSGVTLNEPEQEKYSAAKAACEKAEDTPAEPTDAEKLQERINALPSSEKLAEMTPENQMVVYNKMFGIWAALRLQRPTTSPSLSAVATAL